MINFNKKAAFCLVWVFWCTSFVSAQDMMQVPQDLRGIEAFGNVKNDQDGKKRDPFVALVNPDGKMKSKEELFPTINKKSSLSMNIILKAIIWDAARPLAMINNKIYSEGKAITDGLTIEKIHPNSVDLNDNGTIVTIQLRKTEKKDATP